MVLSPHDLLRLAPGSPLLGEAGSREHVPPWVARALARRQWVVVRRDIGGEGRVPVGVRGHIRRLRYGAWVDAGCVLHVVTPEELAAPTPDCSSGRWVAALEDVACSMAGVELPWGPIGSVGFELATGAPSTGEGSDLDILVRARSPIASGWDQLAARLRDVGQVHGCRLDCQVETPAGGVHLGDLVAPGMKLARTNGGPVLVADPWHWIGRGGTGATRR